MSPNNNNNNNDDNNKGTHAPALSLSMLRCSSPVVVCVQNNESIALSRRIDKHWRLIGWGRILKGRKIKLQSQLSSQVSETVTPSASESAA